MDYTVFTNNPILGGHFKQHPEMSGPDSKLEVKFLAIPAMDVLIAARGAVRQGAALISDPQVGIRLSQARPQRPPQGMRPSPVGFVDKKISPFSPSFNSGKPVAFNPYVSVAVTVPQESMDFQSIKKIEEAISLYRKNAKMRIIAHSDEAIQQFQEADMQVIMAVLAAL